jgi:multidrug resistance efflux pump
VLVAIVVTVVLRNRHRDLVLVGLIDANDVVVSPRVQSRLDSVFVDEGSEVRAGQLIATLEDAELAAQAASVAASATSARAQLDQSRANEREVSGSTEASLAAARARVASARAALAREVAQLALDSANVARSRSLERSGGIAPADLQRVTTTYDAERAMVDARRQDVTAAEAELANAESGAHAVTVARSAVATTEARVRGARADSMAAAARLNYTELRAPTSGVVQVLAARQGELVGPGSPVVVIVDPDRLWVRVAAPETDAGRVAVGDSLEVRLPSGETTRGRVISKAAEGEFATQRDVSSSRRDIRAVALRVAIANPKRRLVPGMTAEVVLPARP